MAIVLLFAALPSAAQSQLWIRQLGTSTADSAVAAAPDGSGGVYVSGHTGGSLGGPSAGDVDAWLARYDGAGNQFWVRQLGTSFADSAVAVAPDGSGGVYVSGYTRGSLGGTSAGGIDAWLARYDSAGNQTWVRQLGTSNYDAALAAAPDGSGSVYVGGSTRGNLGGPSAGLHDAWLACYDSAGNQAWLRQLGTSSADYVQAAAPDGSDGVYVSGSTGGSLGGPSAGLEDAWLARYDSAGNQTWIRQLGTSATDDAFAAAPDGSGGVYVSGYTLGSLGGPSAGGNDVWLARYDGAGNQLWIRQHGTNANDTALAAAPDGSGGVYVGGTTAGSLGGTSAGLTDAWLARYGSAGNQTWIRQLGTSTNESAYAAAQDGLGGVYAGGFTDGSLGGASAGSFDAWLARYEGAGCAATSYCTAKLNSCGGTPALTASGVSGASAASGFVLSASGARPGKSGLFIYTNSGARNPPAAFQGGLLCLNSPLWRSVVTTATGGTPGNCDASFNLDWNAFSSGNAGGNPAGFLTVVGQQVDLQAWGRDTIQNGSFLSDAMSYTMCP